MRDDRPASDLWGGLGLLAVVRGLSLEPELRAGDVVLALCCRRPPRAGELVLARLGDYLAVKRVLALYPACDEVELELLAGERRKVPSAAIRGRVVLALTWRGGRVRLRRP